MALSSLSLWKDAFLQFLDSPTIISPALTNSNTTLALPSNVTVTFAWPNHRLWLHLVTFFIIWVMWVSMRPGERRGWTQRMQKVDGRRHVNGGAHRTTMPLWGTFYNLSQSGLGGQVEQTGSAESSHLSDWTALSIPVTGWVMRANCFNFLRFSFLVYRVKTVTPISQSLHGFEPHKNILKHLQTVKCYKMLIVVIIPALLRSLCQM